MWSRVKDNNRLGTQQNVHWISIKSRLVRAARETSIFQNWSNFANSCHLYIAEILPIRLKTLSNQSILKKIFVKTYHTQEQHNIQRKIKWDLYTSFSLWSHFLITVYSHSIIVWIKSLFYRIGNRILYIKKPSILICYNNGPCDICSSFNGLP